MNKPTAYRDCDTFTRAYIDCLLWCGIMSPDGDGDDGDYTPDDLAPEALARIVEDCEAFQDVLDSVETPDWYDAGDAGHDFYLTRNGHGTGFWDRGLGPVGDTLANMARPYGEFYVWADNGVLIPS